METLLIRNRSKGTVVAQEAGLAKRWWPCLRGLIGRRTLPAGAGLVIDPCSSIHCFFMALPIDVLFVDAMHRVVRAAPDVRPWSVGPIVPEARYVVELPVGAIAASGTAEGDELEWVR